MNATHGPVEPARHPWHVSHMSRKHLQSFTVTADPSEGPIHLAALRAALAAQKLHGFIVPRADEYQGEYVPASEARLAWLTGFTGSAGLAVVLKRKAALFIDGRYIVQAREQVDVRAFKPVLVSETSPEAWLSANLSKDQSIGYDPALHTPDEIARYETAARKAGARLTPVEPNPIDGIWAERPEAPVAPVTLHPLEFAGEEAAAKIARIQQALAEERCDALLISDPHSMAWTFNIRGGDVGHTPLPLGYALMPREGRPTLFLDARKLSNLVRDELSRLAEIAEPATVADALRALGEAKRRVRLDAASVGIRLKRALEAAGGLADVGKDPVALMKATKNPVEIAGSRSAHLRDGVAMARFLAWFDSEAPKGGLTEISAAMKLEDFRVATGKLKDLSFPTISAAGPNAALPHYRVTEASNRAIGPGIYLVDSGAQYEDGTTDITRTIAVGEPTNLMRDRFTRVLKGMIAISRAVFPKGVSGAQIDAFARQFLWQAGLDFDHGTGHGIGSYLSVHEGPQRISKAGTAPLQPGMIISNEPGYYAAGRFGIRIENLVVVEERRIAGAERVMFGFETITLAPIDQRLVESKLPGAEEIAWLNAYHARVRKALTPLVDRETRAWLKDATRPLVKATR